jgi:imidazolonepropionase-like amidohydrolase
VSSTVFRDVRVFDGRSDSLTEVTDVVVADGRIASIGPRDEPAPAGADERRVIDGAGRVLMPGLIDAHVHTMFGMLALPDLLSADGTYIGIAAASGAEAMLQRGFTSVRDAGGPSFGLKRAIDAGLVAGPRIWPSGAFISQTAGHGDFRSTSDLPRGVCGHHSYPEIVGGAVIADGVPEVLRGVREQLMRGASQIKVMAGGGVNSSYDPLDVAEYTEDELRAAVDAATDWGTYVLVHAFTPRAVQRAVRAGVRCIDHGHLLDDETVSLMAENDVWWSLQPFLDDEFSRPQADPRKRAKQLAMVAGTDTAYGLARKHGVKLAWGTDALFDPELARSQGAQLAKMTRWFSPAESLRMATSSNADLLSMSGERNPYPGRLGVVEVGALADLLLVDGDPLADITLVARPEVAFVVIMKDGVVHKDTVSG